MLPSRIVQVALFLITTIVVNALENVAQNKLASQSGSYFTYSTPEKAIDGNTDSRMEAESCVHPDTRQLPGEENNNPAWWRVDLGSSYDVYKVVIVNRNINRDRLSDTWVTVSDEENALPNSDNICNEIVNGDGDLVTVTCDYYNRKPPLRGRYVTIRRKDNAQDRLLLNFCEVEVLSCLPGSWGYKLDNAPDCLQSCFGCSTVETCRVSDGYCFTGCKDGFWGGSCDKQCNCPHGTPCNPTDGSCPSGSTTTMTATATTIAVEETADEEGISTGLVAAIAVLSLVLIIAVMVALFLYKRYKNQRKNRNNPTHVSSSAPGVVAETTPIPENTVVYEEIREYEDLKQNKQEKPYENSEVVDKIYVSLKPAVMDTIRDHIQSTNDNVSRQQSRYQNVTLPEPVYDSVYAGRQPIPVALRDVKGYVNQIQEEIQKFKEQYQDEAQLLYAALIDGMETTDTALSCSQFSSFLLNISSSDMNSTLLEQYQVLELLKPPQNKNQKSGLHSENIAKNRNEEIIPDDKFRPILRTSSVNGTNYINAVIVTRCNKGDNYILTQSPLEETVVDLWRLIYDYSSSTIIMLNQIPTDQEQRSEAVVYWPSEVATSMRFGSIMIANNSYSVDSKNKNIHVRELELSIEDNGYESEQSTIKQFCIKEWNQSTLIRDFIRLTKLIEKWQSEASSQNGPVVIHCLNGAERSGLFCVALYVAEQIKTQQNVDIFSAVKHIRLYRPQCITTMEQYTFLHNFALEYIKYRN